MFRQNNETKVKSIEKTMISIQFNNNNFHLQEIIQKAFNKSLGCDIVLKIGPNLQEFKCHQSILSFSSDFLSKLILIAHEKHKDPILILPEFDPFIIEMVLAYIYSGEINLPNNLIKTFCETCSLLEIKGIVEQQYKLLDYIETLNADHPQEKIKDEIVTEYTIIPSSEPQNEEMEDDDDSQNQDEYEHIEMSDDTSLMEEEYVMEDELSNSNQVLGPICVQEQSVSIPKPIVIQKVNEKSINVSPPKKVRLKSDIIPLIKTRNLMKLEKFQFAFNEIEGSVGNWKHARLLADGTANINAVNVQYFKERLEICTSKIYENVHIEDTNFVKYKVRMYFCPDPVRLKAVVECLLCEKTIQVSYKHKNGKFKQWINSNVLRHVETMHKEHWRPPNDDSKKNKNRY
uniref:CSON002504 protein n=1 Tax=Culicoides sonorensis TaxID=179676 RepID=A0A336MKP9_CULSO